MLRDIRIRFFNHGLGYLVAIAWPLAHILILLGFYAVLGRAPPYGESGFVFFGAALVPFMAWNYMSRFIMLSLIMNRPLLAFPAVKVMDILLGRAALEVLASCCMILFLAAIAFAAGIDFMPADVVDAAAALVAALALGLGFGMVSAIIAMAFPPWVTIYTLLIILFYITSGILFVPATLPAALLEPLSWLPTLHAVEWMRVAYFEGYPDSVLNREYLIGWAIGAVLLGFGLERLLRGRLLGG